MKHVQRQLIVNTAGKNDLLSAIEKQILQKAKFSERRDTHFCLKRDGDDMSWWFEL